MIYKTERFWDDDNGAVVVKHESISDEEDVKFSGQAQVVVNIPNLGKQSLNINFEIRAAKSVVEAFKNFDESLAKAKDNLRKDLKKKSSGLALPNSEIVTPKQPPKPKGRPKIISLNTEND